MSRLSRHADELAVTGDDDVVGIDVTVPRSGNRFVAHDNDGGSCANSGTSQMAYVITKNTISVINQELASIDPFGINCGGIGIANRYRCFIPR